MEYRSDTPNNDELKHYGRTGMRWGVRLYQNKDGSLTAAGRRRYNKEAEKLNKETAKVAAAEKAAANRKKVQSKFDSLEAKKQELEARKKALKDGKDPEEEAKKAAESAEEKKARLLDSVDAKELYENKGLLTTYELNERINRIDTEARLQSKIVQEHQKTGLDYMNNARQKIDATVNLYRSIDNAYSTVTNSALGKTLAKKLGLEPPKKGFDLSEFVKNIAYESDANIASKVKRVQNTQTLIDANNKQQNKIKADAEYKKRQKEAEKQAKKESKAAEKESKAAEKQRKETEKEARRQAAEQAAAVKQRQEEVQRQIDAALNNLNKSAAKLSDAVNTPSYNNAQNIVKSNSQRNQNILLSDVEIAALLADRTD